MYRIFLYAFLYPGHLELELCKISLSKITLTVDPKGVLPVWEQCLLTLFNGVQKLEVLMVIYIINLHYSSQLSKSGFMFSSICKFCFIPFFETSFFCCSHTASQKVMRKSLKLSPYSFFSFVNANQKHILIPQYMLIIKHLD